MNWILDNLQIVLLLALAFASWLKTRYDSKKAAEEEQEPAADPTVWDDDAEESWRRMEERMEGSEEPPLVRRAEPPPLVRTVVAVPPPLPAAVPEPDFHAVLEEQRAIEERLREIRQPRKAAPALLAGQKRRPRREDPAGFLGKSLQDPRSARRAVALREILGPPVGLR